MLEGGDSLWGMVAGLWPVSEGNFQHEGDGRCVSAYAGCQFRECTRFADARG